MLYIQWTKAFNVNYKTFLLGMALVFAISANAQHIMYQEDHDLKPYYFGITLGINKATFHADMSPSFLQQDTVRVAEPANSGGFSLGLAATTRLSNRFELRFNPQLIFTERDINYKLRYPDIDNLTLVTKKVESVIASLPLDVKFNSDRIGNFRVYMLGGAKFDMDFASNAKARKADDMIQIGKYDYGVEAGFGMNFYFPSFIFSPEIKFSDGLNDLHARNPNLIYSRVLDRIQSRMIMFTIHLEG